MCRTSIENLPEYVLFQVLCDSDTRSDAQKKIKEFNRKVESKDKIMPELVGRKAFGHMFAHFKRCCSSSGFSDRNSVEQLRALQASLRYYLPVSLNGLKYGTEVRGAKFVQADIGKCMIEYTEAVADGCIKVNAPVEHEQAFTDNYKKLPRINHFGEGVFDPYRPNWRPGGRS